MSFFTVPQKILTVDPTIVGSKDLFIAQTEADAAAAIAAGFPALAFTNNLRTNDNFITLINSCTKSERAYILNTSGDTMRLSEIGFKLASQWLPVFVVSLFDTVTARHTSVVEYLKAHTPADFKALVKQAPSFIDILIGQLPENFPHAVSDIKGKILPLLVNLELATVKHYVDAIRKKVKTTVKVIDAMMAELKRSQATSDKAEEEPTEEDEDEETDPEILAAAAELALKPALLKDRIDVVNKLGVAGERKNIALITVTVDSRLLKDQGTPGQNALACKITGHPGSGKSYILLETISLYPKSAIILITSASEKSLYYLNNGLAHKCLVIMEAFQFSNDRGDSELAYTVRTLLSEGKLIRAITQRDPETGKYVTAHVTLDGPVSLLTTTIQSILEAQLDDRFFTVHSDESIDQTKKIISNRAKQKAGGILKRNEREIRTWQEFHRSLQSVSVTIPCAERIADYLNQKPHLPLPARRAFTKVLNVIQSITCAYQFQRERDANGNLIATTADYFMALQVVSEAFRENMGQLPKATSERLAYLATQGRKTLMDIANHFGVSKVAVSKWAGPLERDGIIEWADINGNSFPTDTIRNAAKSSGRAYLQVTGNANNAWGNIGLPMPSDIDPNPDWLPGGAQFELYHLRLTPDAPKAAVNPFPVPVPIAAATSPMSVSPTPVLSGVTASPGGPSWAKYFPAAQPGSHTETEPVGFIESNQTVSAHDQAYWDGIAALTESSPKDQSRAHDPEAEHEFESDDSDHENPLI